MNPALKLKKSVIEEQFKKHGVVQMDQSEISKIPSPDHDPGEGTKLKWQYFDEEAYIAKTRVGPRQDAYQRNKFNQVESDKLQSNRDVPDTRHRK